MIERIKWVSSLEKVFPDREPRGGFLDSGKKPSFLEGEVYSAQFAFLTSCDGEGWAEVALSGPFAEYATVREVCPMPSRNPGRELVDIKAKGNAPAVENVSAEKNTPAEENDPATETVPAEKNAPGEETALTEESTTVEEQAIAEGHTPAKETVWAKLCPPGLYPDLLRELKDGRVRLYPGQWHSLWITVECGGKEGKGKDWDRKEYSEELSEEKPSCEFPYGIHELEIAVKPEEGEQVRACLELELIHTKLPEQTLLHTEWFHADCLADYYRVEPWSEEHWRIVENFLNHYGEMGMNMVLVPVLTPPLDTAVGRERTTVQLTDIREEGEGRYSFGFERVKRYVELCEKAGIRYLEISHLFTQWGACAAPKVMVWQGDGDTQVRRFGWDTPSDGSEYLGFLEQFLKALTGKLTEWGWEGRAFFHLSDEPGEDVLERYNFLRSKVTGWIAPYPIMDALSDYSFYESGAVDRAVPNMGKLPLFAEKGVSPLWTYYCGCHVQGMPNRHFAMPSCQIRVLGVLLYYYGVDGFLHWGYNFYNSQYSLEHINPYAVTDAGGAFPSGDSFLVYPGEDGRPEDSLRMMLMLEAMQDMQALQLLEGLWGRERVTELIRREAGGEVTALKWPRGPEFLEGLREKVNEGLSCF
ncbi:MAG: DUF4091 domain-containing protein [Lachnospiraceae bacterium]|nr:DUF4091 domain-containing protein [Lachnospiraceae bacterium]